MSTHLWGLRQKCGKSVCRRYAEDPLENGLKECMPLHLGKVFSSFSAVIKWCLKRENLGVCSIMTEAIGLIPIPMSQTKRVFKI